MWEVPTPRITPLILEIEIQEFNTIILESFRYCLGRRSYAVSNCVDRILKYWKNITDNTKKLILKEIRTSIDLGSAGDECDIFEWEKVLRGPEL